MDHHSTINNHLDANKNNAEAISRGQLPEIPTQGSFTLEQILRYHSVMLDVLRKYQVCELVLSSEIKFLHMLETTRDLLLLFNAAKATYFESNCPQLNPERNGNGPDVICLRSAISIGRQTFQGEESDVISRTIIKSSVIQLGKEVADLKKWLLQPKNRSDPGQHTDREISEMEQLEKVLTDIWVFVAGTRG